MKPGGRAEDEHVKRLRGKLSVDPGEVTEPRPVLCFDLSAPTWNELILGKNHPSLKKKKNQRPLKRGCKTV